MGALDWVQNCFKPRSGAESRPYPQQQYNSKHSKEFDSSVVAHDGHSAEKGPGGQPCAPCEFPSRTETDEYFDNDKVIQTKVYCLFSQFPMLNLSSLALSHCCETHRNVFLSAKTSISSRSASHGQCWMRWGTSCCGGQVLSNDLQVRRPMDTCSVP